MADSTDFSVGQKTYHLSGGNAVIRVKNGKTQLLIAVRDGNAKAQLAIMAEIPGNLPETPIILSAEHNALSAVIVNPSGIYSIAPNTMLSHDTAMQYTAKEEIETGELEDDPTDKPQKNHARRKRKRRRVAYKKHGPTWVGKSRRERLDSGDGVLRESKYKDSTLSLSLVPVITGGKITSITGTFAGVVVYNQGMSAPQNIPLKNGRFTMQVQYVD